MKKIISMMLCIVMTISVMAIEVPSFAEEETSAIDLLGATRLFTAPDGSFNDTAVSEAFSGWTSQVNAGYANVKTYSTGTTLQYYVNGQNTSLNHDSVVTSPGYGQGSDKIVIEWVMKRDTAKDLYFDFSFRDTSNAEIAYLKLDKNAVAPGQSHAQNDELYAMGFPDTGAVCAIAAYNNDDKLTHTADFYVNGEIVTKLESLEGTIDGFGSIVSSNGSWSTAYKHIGFSCLAIGAVYDENKFDIVNAEYKIGSDVVKTVTKVFSKSDNDRVFPTITIYYNNDLWYCGDTVMNTSGVIELTKIERYKSKNVGDVFEMDGNIYKVVGDSVIVNGNFVTNDATCWTNRTGGNVSYTSVSYTEEIGANMLNIEAGGKDAANNIGTMWDVVPNRKYYLSFYVGGTKPGSNNVGYNCIFESDKTTPLVSYGEEMPQSGLTRFEKIIQPVSSGVYFQCSWAELSFGNFELIPVEEYEEVQTVYPVIEDAFVHYGTLYGIGTAYEDGVLIASSNDINRGPEFDANGEATYLDGADPTTLGSTRVGLMKFGIRELAENERATLKFYVKRWHSQGFDGGNTFLRIAANPLADSSWADMEEGAAFSIENAELLSTWATPIFSEKAYKTDEIVKIDVTEAVKAAWAAGLEELSFKLRIFWGAAYVVEREAADDGAYEGKAAFIEIEEDENLKKITTSGAATLTKNGSAMNGFSYVTEEDDIRLQLDGAYVIGSDEGCYFPNEKLTFTENTRLDNTLALGFGLTMLQGAQVRFGDGVDGDGNVGSGNGLRFITNVNRTDTLAGLDDCEIGVIISAEGSDIVQAVTTEKWQDDMTFTTAVTNLAVNNYNRHYTATPYVKAGGRTFTGESVTRSIYQVASGLLVKDDTDGTVYPDEAMNKMFYDVLNAYVNQVGIRLAFSDNADFTDWELSAKTSGKGAYTGDAFFAVSDCMREGKKYSVLLTPLGKQTKFNLTDNYWNNYVRINNNNSQIKAVTTLEDNNDGTYTLTFDTEGLILGTYPEEKFNMMKPTYDDAVLVMQKVNSYWQSYQSYDNWYGSTHPAFWDKSAYHTGNMEYYLLTGDDTYLDYTINWAKYNNWMGNNNTTADPESWTWGYNQTQGSNAVLFGDWQTCFQVYIDLYNAEIEGANIDRVYEVIDYQISTDRDSYWWWADALYMVMPTMTKLYKLTGNEAYLDALYKYFKYAKELMYDGPGGIPTDETGYTTSAALNSGASYSDASDYKYLFFRDAGYVYPLKPNNGHENEKNFWARGNGWVFAALCKVLSDMPSTYEHYDEFYSTYVQMAEAVADCQQLDDNGYGFWTQSMLQDYPKGSNGNSEGYETSGTAFLTYGLFWGVNNNILTEAKYENAAVRGWGYLKNVALHDSGKVGYVQPIGSNATEATSFDTTVNFGVGAYLLAACEAARYAQ